MTNAPFLAGILVFLFTASVNPAVKEVRRAAGKGYLGSGAVLEAFDSSLLTYQLLSLSKGIEHYSEGNVSLKFQAG